MKQLHYIVDLQFGSTGKGLLAGKMAEEIRPDTLITAWGPNAGHTYIDATGEKYVNIALPNGIVSPDLKRILIGPGSIINPEIMMAEIRQYERLLDGVEILIHPHAAVVTEAMREAERKYGFQIGSTMKGVGEAVINKIRRDPRNINIAREALKLHVLEEHVVTEQEYNAAVNEAEIAIVEGAQGYSLSINHGFYPYTTSRDCTVQQLNVDCGLPRKIGCQPMVHGVARTFPIRVANRFDDEGKQIGTSGPCYPDQREITWDELGMKPELTTVTKLPRRIFTFSEQQVAEAICMNGVDNVFLNFANYMGDRLDDHYPEKLNEIIDAIDRYAHVRWLGWGPSALDVEDRLYD